jgi:hypothetical protein
LTFGIAGQGRLDQTALETRGSHAQATIYCGLLADTLDLDLSRGVTSAVAHGTSSNTLHPPHEPFPNRHTQVTFSVVQAKRSQSDRDPQQQTHSLHPRTVHNHHGPLANPRLTSSPYVMLIALLLDSVA